MERVGFIHNMMDVKVLILYVMARVETPIDREQVYALCFQDDCLSYFDLQTALPQLVDTGHLQEDESGLYTITEKGRTDGTEVEDSLAFPVMQRAKAAVEQFNWRTRREQFIKADMVQGDGGDWHTVMELRDAAGALMKLELTAPNRQQAKRLADAFYKNAEVTFQMIMTSLLDDEVQEENRTNAQ